MSGTHRITTTLPTLLAAACLALPIGAQSTGWRVIEPASFTLLGRPIDRRLAEASGLAPSVANPGLYWAIGDSGNPPELLAIDSTGALRGRVVLAGTTNTDWEAVSVGPCGERTCVYVGDLGDNRERRSAVAIYRIVEPRISDTTPITVSQVETLRLRYPGNLRHDVEAMAALPDGALLLVTKGRSRGVLLYQVAAKDWGTDAPVEAVGIDSLPIDPHAGTGRLVTDMAVTPDGSRMVVRTYRDLYVFSRSSDGSVEPVVSCNIVGREPQGEGVAWLPDGRLLLLSERGLFKTGTVHAAKCG